MNILQIIKVPYLCFIVVLFMACNVTKKMDKQADRAINNPYVFGKVGTAWIMRYGCLADTLKDTVYQGIPVIHYRDTTIHDTIPQPVPCKAFRYVTPRGVIITVDTTGRLTVEDKRRDSIVYVPQIREVQVTDRKQVNALADSLAYYKQGYQLAKKDVKIAQQESKEARTARNIAYIALALAVGGGIIAWVKFK
jgi:hypothetical protein